MKRHSILKHGLLLCLCTLPAVSFSAENDWLYRQDLVANIQLAGKWSVHSRSSATLFDNASDLLNVFTGLNLGYRFLPDWRAEAGYRQIWIDPGGLKRAERRSQLALAWKGSLGELPVSNRSRLEFRDYDWTRKDDIRFRNRTGISLPWSVLVPDIHPYLEEEFFIGHNRRKFEMNWLTGGLAWKASPQIRIKAGYRWLAVRTANHWENRNMVVGGVFLNF